MTYDSLPPGGSNNDPKFLAVDYGLKRTGLALSSGKMAFPRKALLMRGKDIFFSELLSLAGSERIDAFVIGLPLRSDGQDSETTRQVRNMAARLKRRSPLPVFFMDESLSSQAAEEKLREAGQKGRTLLAKLDSAAAVAILESFLALPENLRQKL